MARSDHFLKASRRDLSAAVARGLDAATTVSATLWIARQAGLGVLATGGLGGVHRGASTTFDISTDLDELARADGMAVVCSGVKSILDVPATLDALETRGVAVVGYRTDDFPAFTTVSSGLRWMPGSTTPRRPPASSGPIGLGCPEPSCSPSRSTPTTRSTATRWKPRSPRRSDLARGPRSRRQGRHAVPARPAPAGDRRSEPGANRR